MRSAVPHLGLDVLPIVVVSGATPIKIETNLFVGMQVFGERRLFRVGGEQRGRLARSGFKREFGHGRSGAFLLGVVVVVVVVGEAKVF